MSIPSFHPVRTTCAVLASAAAGWSLTGILSCVASVVAIALGGLQLYVLWRDKIRK